MYVNGKHYESVWFENNTLKLIDQRKIPFSFEIYESRSYESSVNAIKNMVVRGAPAIGVAAAFTIAQLCIEAKNLKDFEKGISNILISRPTARDLFYAIERVSSKVKQSKKIESARKLSIEEASLIKNEIVDACRRIGEFGKLLIADDFRILTHCNAGWLATVDYGTALSPIFLAKKDGKNVFVWVSETRPRLQGARLTAWELKNEGIEHKIVVDSACGFLMEREMVDIVIVGADRIAANGDFANKVGTYEKAVIAKENGIPFYVAAPLSTFDLKTKSGKEIVIEHRSNDEVKYIHGIDDKGRDTNILILNPDSDIINPAFDITPAKYVSGIITEHGIVKPNREDIESIIKKGTH